MKSNSYFLYYSRLPIDNIRIASGDAAAADADDDDDS